MRQRLALFEDDRLVSLTKLSVKRSVSCLWCLSPAGGRDIFSSLVFLSGYIAGQTIEQVAAADPVCVGDLPTKINSFYCVPRFVLQAQCRTTLVITFG